jgi:hypothetical protein
LIFGLSNLTLEFEIILLTIKSATKYDLATSIMENTKRLPNVDWKVTDEYNTHPPIFRFSNE